MFVLALAPAFGCASDDGEPVAPVCGDLVCEGGETALSCADDCGGATCSPSDPTSCGGETICIGGACVPAFGRNYVFTVRAGTFPQFDSTGAPWDAAGGLPDGFVVLTVNGAPFTTATTQDNLAPSWNAATGPTLVPGGTVLRIDVYDEDLTVDDLAWSCEANPLSASLLRGGAMRCAPPALPGASVDVDVRPN